MIIHCHWGVFILLLVSIGAGAQQDISLSGVVVVQNSRFHTGQVDYLSQVRISALKAGSTTSDQHGRFTLQFVDMAPGARVKIEAEKAGYELVNSREVENAAIAGRIRPLRVVMCPAGSLVQNQLAYYQIAEDAAEKEYRKRIAILEQEGRERAELMAALRETFQREMRTKGEALQALEEQYQRLRRQAAFIAEKFVRINLDDQSDTYQRAFRAFQGGDIRGAISILDSVDHRWRLELNEAEIQKAKKRLGELQESRQRRIRQIQLDIRGKLLEGRLQLDAGNSGGRTGHILSAEPEGAAVLEELVNILIEQDGLPGEQKKTYYHGIAQLLEEAIEVYEQLIFQGADDIELERALCYDGLGRLHSRYGNRAKAESAFQEALEVYQGAKRGLPPYPTLAAESLIQLARLARRSDDRRQAVDYLREAASLLALIEEPGREKIAQKIKVEAGLEILDHWKY